MASEPKFQKPAAYDPSLLAQEKSAANVEKKMASDLGLDDVDFDVAREESVSPTNVIPPPPGGSSVDSQIADELRGEVERLTELFKNATSERVKAEQQCRKLQETIERENESHKKQMAILLHRQKMTQKALRQEVQDKEDLIKSDEKELISLKEQLAQALGEAAAEDGSMANAAVEAKNDVDRFFKERELQRELLEVKAKLSEVTAGEDARQAELEEAKKSLEKLQSEYALLQATKGSARDLNVLLDMQRQIDELTLERTLRRNATGANSGADPTAASLAKELESLRKGKAEADAAMEKLQGRLVELEGKLRKAGDGAQASAKGEALETAEKKIKELTEELMNTANSLATLKTASMSGTQGLTAEVDRLKQALTKSEALVTKREEMMRTLKTNAQNKLNEAKEHIEKYRVELRNVRAEHDKLKLGYEARLRKLQESMQNQRTASVQQRKKLLQTMNSVVTELRDKIASLKNELAGMEDDTEGVVMKIAAAVKKHSGANADLIKTLRENYERELRLRKKVFNQLQELRGNIRVYARVRPLSDKEVGDKKNHEVMQFIRDGELRIENSAKKQVHTFEFERVFRPESKQEEVFEEVQDLITSVLDGFNVCIFAYGQTGSGKTFTMEGPKENAGVNTRALEKLFAEAASKASEWQYNFRLTLLEIYNEKVQDLLSDSGEALKVVNGQHGMEVLGLQQMDVASPGDVQKLLARGKKNRHITKTDMNDHSSRSHLILSVYVQGKNKLTGVQSMGKLHLIDLAGSERISRSGVTGEALKEAQKINYSLSALGNVISARANKADHVPYRNSMLTYLLQDSLEKNSKTLMFVQLSPTLESVAETLCSLRFAERVRKVELGKAVKNQGPAAGSGKPPADDYRPEDDYQEYDGEQQ